MTKITLYQKKFTNVMISFVMLASVLAFPKPASAMSSSTIAALTNQQRASAGLSALSWNGLLSTSAMLKAQDMCAKDYWAHNSPDGLTPWTFMARAGYSYVAAGENLAKGYSTEAGVMSGWMASPTHQANILNTKYTDIGVASLPCTIQGQATTVVVAHYGSTRAVSQPAATPAPRKASAPAPRATQRTVPAQAQVRPTITAQVQAVPTSTPVISPKPEPKKPDVPAIITYSQSSLIGKSPSTYLLTMLHVASRLS